MELTVSRLLLVALPVVALCLVGGVPTTSDAQRIASFPSAAGYKTTSRDRARGPFPRKGELMQALDFLEAYERGINENDWNRDQDVDGGFLYGDEADGDALDFGDTLDLEDTNEIYPEDLDLDFRQETEGYPEKLPTEDNTVDIPPWLVSYLLREGQGNEEEYSPQEEEPNDLPWGVDDQELLEELLEEEEAEEETEAEAEDETYREEMERVEEEAIADIVEQEMEDMAVKDILDDIRGEEVLQEDAEENLKWLLIEEEERFQREEENEEEEDPFQFEFSSSEADSYPAAEPGGDSPLERFGESLLYGHGGEYPMVEGSEEAEVGESLDEAELDELMEEAAEMLDLQDMEDEEEERRNKLWDRRVFEGVVGSLTKEEMGEEGAAEEDEEQEEFDEKEEQPSFMLDAGMGDVGSEEDVQQEVYNELAEFLENEIDQAVENLAGDILQAMDEEAKGEIEEEGVGGGVGEEAIDEDGEWNAEGAASTEEGSQNVTPEGSEDEGDGCSSLQYFIDDCNIVNNYGDLGADGYKDLFAGACNRHQLCYACGEYYDVGGQLCDELYKAEMLALCDLDDTGCKKRAKYFWLVAQNNRVPEVDSSPICADRCVLNYMIEV